MIILLTGILAAIVHVLSGPDHLAAVVPLVLDSERKHWRIGMFWGLGHVLGMVFIGLLFYFFKDSLPIEKFSNLNEKIVGVILISIGVWSLYRVRHFHTKHSHPHIHSHDDTRFIHAHKHQHSHDAHKHSHATSKDSRGIKSLQSHRYALWIGVIHGFAGISHFVLMFPVLGYQSKLESIEYLSGFALGTIVAMLLFSILIGRISHLANERNPKQMIRDFRFWGGVLAIMVGLYWFFV